MVEEKSPTKNLSDGNSNKKVNLHIVFKAAKPKLMNEKIMLYSSTDPTIHLEVALLARVLGKH